MTPRILKAWTLSDGRITTVIAVFCLDVGRYTLVEQRYRGSEPTPVSANSYAAEFTTDGEALESIERIVELAAGAGMSAASIECEHMNGLALDAMADALSLDHFTEIKPVTTNAPGGDA